jgi:hypothetical protein
MRSSRRYGWVVILIVDVGMLVYGAMAVVFPDKLVPGYESYASRNWSELVTTDLQTPGFILLLFRLLGGYNLAFAVLAIGITVTAFRPGQRWAWWALLVGNSLAFGASMTYDQIVGSIGVFEMLEFVGIAAIYAALAATAPLLLASRPSDPPTA